MIYLLDEKYRRNSHSFKMLKILVDQNCQDIEHITLPKEQESLERIIDKIGNSCNENDILFCPWILHSPSDTTSFLEYTLEQVSQKICTVAPAGNINQSIEHFIPARLSYVYTAASLNKSGAMTVYSNTNDINKERFFYIVGTNYRINKKVKESGTCVSSAILTSLIWKNQYSNTNQTLQEMINTYNTSIVSNYRNNNGHKDSI